MKSQIQLLPILNFSTIRRLLKSTRQELIRNSKNKFLTLALINLSSFKGRFTTRQVKDLIDNKMSQFLYLPPDGTILKEPMVIDFDLILPVDGTNKSVVDKALKAKRLQVSSPFREFFAQNFANHFSKIGIEDSEIKSNEYVKSAKEFIK